MFSEHSKKYFFVVWSVAVFFIVMFVSLLTVFLIKNKDNSSNVSYDLEKIERQKLLQYGTAPGGSVLTNDESETLFESGTSNGELVLSEDEKLKLIESSSADGF